MSYFRGPAHPIEGIFPDDHLDEFRDKTFCFVHIDVDVYRSAKDVLAFAWPRIPVGGVVVFDDYGVPNCNGITVVVDEYKGRSSEAGGPDRVVLYNLNGHAVMVKGLLDVSSGFQVVVFAGGFAQLEPAARFPDASVGRLWQVVQIPVKAGLSATAFGGCGLDRDLHDLPLGHQESVDRFWKPPPCPLGTSRRR